jgi:hypothetical protein
MLVEIDCHVAHPVDGAIRQFLILRRSLVRVRGLQLVGEGSGPDSGTLVRVRGGSLATLSWRSSMRRGVVDFPLEATFFRSYVLYFSIVILSGAKDLGGGGGATFCY